MNPSKASGGAPHPFELLPAARENSAPFVRLPGDFSLVVKGKVARAILADTGRTNEPSAPSIVTAGQTLAAAAKSEQWKLARKISLGAFGRTALKEEGIGATAASALRHQFSLAATSERVPVGPAFQRIFGRATMRLLVGHEPEALATKAEGFMSHVSGIADGARQLPRWHPRVRRASAAAQQLRDEVRRSALHEPATSEGVLDRIARCPVDESVLTNFGKVLATGAYGAPGIAFAWVVVILNRDPSLRELVATEVALTTPEEVAADCERVAPVLNSLVQEVLRLNPPIWLYTREVTKTVKVAELELEPGHELGICAYASNRDEEWGDDGAEFRPERWRDGGHRRLPTPLTFGFGPRACVGGHLAIAMLCAATVLAINEYEVTLFDLDAVAPAPNSLLSPAGLMGTITTRSEARQ